MYCKLFSKARQPASGDGQLPTNEGMRFLGDSDECTQQNNLCRYGCVLRFGRTTIRVLLYDSATPMCSQSALVLETWRTNTAIRGLEENFPLAEVDNMGALEREGDRAYAEKNCRGL